MNLKFRDAKCDAACDDLYAEAAQRRRRRALRRPRRPPRPKFATMDLIGLPWQLVVGPRGLAAGKVELKRRRTGAREELSAEAALAK